MVSSGLTALHLQKAEWIVLWNVNYVAKYQNGQKIFCALFCIEDMLSAFLSIRKKTFISSALTPSFATEFRNTDDILGSSTWKAMKMAFQIPLPKADSCSHLLSDKTLVCSGIKCPHYYLLTFLYFVQGHKLVISNLCSTETWEYLRVFHQYISYILYRVEIRRKRYR